MAAFSISEFLSSAFKYDGARPNLFTITLPDINFDTDKTINQPDANAKQNFAFKCRASSIPSSQIGIVSAYYFGRQVKFAGNREFSNWTVTVMMDENDYEATGIRGYFEIWLNQLNAHVGNVRSISEPSNYMKMGTVTQYKKNGDVMATYEMHNCFPVAVSEIQLDWGANAAIAEFNVVFAMQWWQRTNTTDTSTNPIKNPIKKT